MTQEVSKKRPDTSLRAIAKSFSVKPGTPLSPYICSTVHDFKNEHGILHEKVFPKLTDLCFLRKTHFTPVDFGWNHSLRGPEDSEEVLRLSLDYVTKCAPFFLCLLGERYGSFRDPTQPQLSCCSMDSDAEQGEAEKQSSLNRNLLFAASSGYRWLLDDTHQYLSITELLIRHAVFSADGSPASAAAQHFSFFYLRQPDHVELLESSLKHLGPDERSRELALYESESESAALYVEQLKLNIIKKGLSIRYFCTTEQLATFAFDDWKSVIDFLYPPFASRAISSEWFSEEIELNIFSATCRRLFVHTNELDCMLNKITGFALDRIISLKSSEPNRKTLARRAVNCGCKTASEKMHSIDQGRDESLLLLVGSRGCGKSNLLATWVDSFRRASPPVKIFEHYVGCTESSTNAVAMMKRCIACLRSTRHYMPGIDYGFNVDGLDEYHRIREEFHAVIGSEDCVLVLDNVDGLFRCRDSSDHLVKDLKWLPFPLPPSVTVIASCTKTDVAYHSLAGRPDVKVIFFPAVEDIRSRKAMLVKNTELNGKALVRGDVDLVLDGCLADRPLYLALLGAEMRAFVGSERMLACLRSCGEASSICDLWGHIVRRWMDEYSWGVDGKTDTEFSGWVPDTLRLISTSRNGLMQSELLSILVELGFTGSRSISSFDWLRFQLAASSVLVWTAGGLIHFMHDHVREATDFLLFGCITPLSGYRKLERTPFEDSGLATPECHLPSKFSYHRHIADYFVQLPFGARQADELPWQFNKLQDYEMLAKLISDHRNFMELYGKGSRSNRAAEILGYWKTLLKAGFSAGTMYLDELRRLYSEYANIKHTSLLDPQMKPSCFAQRYCKLSICIGQLLMQLGCPVDAREAMMCGIHHLNKIMPLSKAQLILRSRLQAMVGSVFVDCEGGRSEAVKWYEQALATIESLLNNVLWDKQRRNLLETKGCLLVYLGNVKTENGDYSEAKSLFKSARHCMLQAKNAVGRALVLSSVGLLQMLQTEFDQSEESLRSALDTLESYHGKSHPNVARIYSVLGNLAANTENSGGFDVIKAEEFYRTAIKLNEECFGPCHVLVANDLLHLGILLWCDGKSSQKEEAHETTKRAFDICTLKLGDDHSLTRRIRDELAGQEIQMTLQLQALQETATPIERQTLLPNTGKSKVPCKHQMSLCKTSQKPAHLPVIRSFSDDTIPSSILEIPESDTPTTPPKRVAFVPPRPISQHTKRNESVLVEFSQNSDEPRRYTPEQIKRRPVPKHPGSAQTYRTFHAAGAIPRHKTPEGGAQSEEIQDQAEFTPKRTSTGTSRHLSCFEYNERLPRSITSGPYAAIHSLLNKKTIQSTNTRFFTLTTFPYHCQEICSSTMPIYPFILASSSQHEQRFSSSALSAF